MDCPFKLLTLWCGIFQDISVDFNIGFYLRKKPIIYVKCVWGECQSGSMKGSLWFPPRGELTHRLAKACKCKKKKKITKQKKVDFLTEQITGIFLYSLLSRDQWTTAQNSTNKKNYFVVKLQSRIYFYFSRALKWFL